MVDDLRRESPDTEFPKIEPLRPHGSASNVVIVLIYDVGFGAPAQAYFDKSLQLPDIERV